jgi:hypothetical protein
MAGYNMDKLEREYHRFGPWVIEIKDIDDIPEQFSDFTETIMNGIISFKVPVNVERRNLKPGMLLYETVTSVTEDTVIILHYTEGSIDRHNIKYHDILYLQYTTVMLFGELIFWTAQQRFVLDFRPAEYGPVEKALDLIRSKYCDPALRINLGDIQEHVDVQSFLYKTLLAQEMEKENLKLVAYQPSIKLKRKHAKKMRYWQHVSGESGLQDSLYMTNGKELIVMSRLKDVKALERPDYGYRYTYIPLNNIRSIIRESDDSMERLQELSIVLEDVRVVFRVDNSFPADVLKNALKI